MTKEKGSTTEYSSKAQRGIKTDGFENGEFLNFKLGIFDTSLFLYPSGCLSGSAKRGIKTDLFQKGKFYWGPKKSFNSKESSEDFPRIF